MSRDRIRLAPPPGEEHTHQPDPGGFCNICGREMTIRDFLVLVDEFEKGRTQ